MLEVMIHILYHTAFFAIIAVTFWSSNPNDPYFTTFFNGFISLFVCLTTANFPVSCDGGLPAQKFINHLS